MTLKHLVTQLMVESQNILSFITIFKAKTKLLTKNN